MHRDLRRSVTTLTEPRTLRVDTLCEERNSISMKSRAAIMLAPIAALSLMVTVAGKPATMPDIDTRL